MTIVVASFWTWDGWPAVVSIGTLALAAATGGLAWWTRRAVGRSEAQIKISQSELMILEEQTGALKEQAVAVTAQVTAVREQSSATRRQAELSAAALEAAARPILVGVAPRLTDEKERIVYPGGFVEPPYVRSRIHYLETDEDNLVNFSVPLRNVGSGVAFVQGVSLLVEGTNPYVGRISNVVVPPLEMTRVRFSLALKDQMGRWTEVRSITKAGRGGRGQFTIYVVYTAASSEIVTASRITAAEFADGDFHVTKNEIFDGDGEDQRLLTSSENLE